MIRKVLNILTRQERRHWGWHMVLDLFIAVADLVFLAALLLLMNHYTGGVMKGRWASLEPWLAKKDPVVLIGTFFFLFGIKNLAGYFIFRGQCRYLLSVASRISRRKLMEYLGGSYTNYIDIDTSVHIREISYHPREFSQHILGGLTHVFTQSFLILVTVTGIAFFNLKLFGLLLLVLLPPVFGAFYLIRRRLHSVRDVARRSSEKYLQHLQEALTGFVEGNIYHRREALAGRYLADQIEFNESVADQLTILGIPGRMVEVFAVFGLVLILALSGHTAILTIGVFMAAAYKIIPGVVKIMGATGQINTYAFTVDKLATEKESFGPEVTTESIREIRCERLEFSYNGRKVLNRQDLDFRAGDFVGISGPSGKGKSTILNLLLGFLEPESGNIYINGEATDAAVRRSYWSRIAYVKQQPFLLHDTILNNIVLGGLIDDGGRLLDAASVSGLMGIIDAFPEKWDKVIAENGKNISGGQRQRIAFARALYKDADLFILDEPFSELDDLSEKEMMECCLRLTREGKTVLLITHNKKNLSFCHKIIELDEV